MGFIIDRLLSLLHVRAPPAAELFCALLVLRSSSLPLMARGVVPAPCIHLMIAPCSWVGNL
eukprot:3463001-Amphidinium_carterae.1